MSIMPLEVFHFTPAVGVVGPPGAALLSLRGGFVEWDAGVPSPNR